MLAKHSHVAITTLNMEMSTSSSSSDTSAGQRFQPHNRTLEVGSFLEWVAESTTVTHSSADWWDILLPLA